MNIFDYHSNPTELNGYNDRITLVPELAYGRGMKTGEWNEDIIAKSPVYAVMYARNILKGPFPKGEKAIARNARCSLDYAAYVIMKPFPLGEPAIAKDGYNSLLYARIVLGKRFKLGEPAISKYPGYKERYKELFGIDL